MKLNLRIRKSVLAAALTVALAPSVAMAQDSPAMEWVVGFPAGGSSDLVSRLLAEQTSKTLGQNIVVVNKPGAGSNIAAQYVATAKLPMLFSAGFPSLAVNPHLFKKLPYDPEKDFVPLTMMARSPMLLVVSPGTPVSNLREFLAWGKSRPEGISYGSAGPGTQHHLTGELLKDQLAVKLVHVPYRGVAPALNDVAAGQISTAVMDLGAVQQHVISGKVKAMAITSATRWPALPDVPTFQELGYKDLDTYAWQCVVASNATPPELRARIWTALSGILNSPAVKTRILAMGVEAVSSTPEQLASYARAERARWGAVIQKNGITAD